MAILTRKFSQFSDGGDLSPNDTTVGLESGVNSKFTNPVPMLPPGTTSERPPITSLIYYRLRYNTTFPAYEYYAPEFSMWIQLVDAGPGNFTWIDVTDSTLTMIPNHGYKANLSSPIILTLPVLSSFGTMLQVAAFNTGGWTITQNAGQKIIFGGMQTTVGTAGYLASTLQGDSINLICMQDNLTWMVQGGPQGNITVI